MTSKRSFELGKAGSQGKARPTQLATTCIAARPHQIEVIAAAQLKFLSEAQEEAAARAVLRGEDANAGAIAKLIDVIEKIDHVEAHREGPPIRHDEFVAEAEVELGVAGDMGLIVIAATKPAAVDHVHAGFRVIVNGV